MMASGTSGNIYDDDDDHNVLDDDFLDDGAQANVLDPSSSINTFADIEPDEPAATSDRAPLTGNIQSSSSSSQRPLNQNYLTSQIPGEDRRAPQNTIDESVWDTVSRDLFAVWEKMKQVLWPKYLLGGMLQRSGSGTADEESQGFGRDIRGLVGRWPDTDGILQGAMSEGLRDWDLWYAQHGTKQTLMC